MSSDSHAVLHKAMSRYSYPGACESPLTKTLHAASRPTHSVSAISTSQAASSAEKACNKYMREAVHQVDMTLPVLSMKETNDS